jgi:hypothetical protein
VDGLLVVGDMLLISGLALWSAAAALVVQGGLLMGAWFYINRRRQ